MAQQQHTQMFSGLMNERPSSRVRAPPGGHSNNIFGTDRGDDWAMTGKKENVRPISNVFGEPAAPANNDTPMKKTIAPADQVKSILFGEDATQQQVNAAKKKRTGINPITGRRYEEEDAEEEEKKANESKSVEEVKPAPVHTSSKVIHPPGGRTTRLW